MAAIGGCLLLGMNFEELIKNAAKINGVPGRLQVIDCGQKFLTIVDYAHTGDGLEKVLKTLQ